MTAIEFQSVSKSFHRHTGRLLLRHRLAHWFRGQRGERFYALKNVSFELEEGEGLAVIGANGAGKSTLLGLVAGLATPDTGTVTVNGRIAALLELGSGFHPDLTGAENVRVNASLIGLSRRRTAELFDQIVEFAGIGDFIGEPLRTYSTGMIMRLAFSVAINMDPEILLIDEVLAVGDQAFQAKCFERIHRFRHAGKTLLCVSHATGMVQELCDRAIWLDRGELMMSGRIRDVIEAYEGHRTTAAM
jgi:ABC-type polysaccharide/polyol phosphate transport system ATPase subunit